MSSYVRIFIALMVGFALGYLLLPEKTKIETVTKVEYVKGKTVVVTKPDGSSTSTTTWNSQTNTDSETIEKWNEKHVTVSGYYILGKNRHGFGVNLQKDLFGRFGITVGGQYIDKNITGLVGLSIDL